MASVNEQVGVAARGGERSRVSHAPEVDAERAPAGALLMEIGWEVCNPIGGIYQVLRSKAPTMAQRWGNRYMVVGPYMGARSALEVEPRRATGWMGRVLDELRAEGLESHHGRWLVPGRPRVVLLEHGLTGTKLDAVKYRLWSEHGIESPGDDELVDGVVGFAEAIRKLMAVMCRVWVRESGGGHGQRRLLAHMHEWLGGLAIPFIRREQLPVSLVFTTHATLLGRYIATSDPDFYRRLATIDHEAEARRYGIRAQHHYERAAAHGSHVFTTISPITAEECGALLGRKPDLVLPNGLNVEQYSVGHEFQTMHAQFKDRIHQFVMGHFFPSYAFDLDKTLYFFSSGRFEPRNKGFDLCMDACARLNAELRRRGSDVTVVFFIVTRRPTRSLLPEALQSRGVLSELREVCEHISAALGERMFREAAAGRRVSLDSLVDEYWWLRMRRTQAALRTDRLPSVFTHHMDDAESDEIVRTIRRLGLLNHPEDRVKVVYHPDFISPTNPLWGMEYEQFVRGCHLGVFPSAYEPWGYTPLECVTMGVPAVTSDLAGFGRYVAENFADHDKWGLWILPRRGREYAESADLLARRMLEFCGMDRRARVALRNQVEQRSWNFDWSRVSRPYHVAHDLALARARAGTY